MDKQPVRFVARFLALFLVITTVPAPDSALAMRTQSADSEAVQGGLEGALQDNSRAAPASLTGLEESNLFATQANITRIENLRQRDHPEVNVAVVKERGAAVLYPNEINGKPIRDKEGNALQFRNPLSLVLRRYVRLYPNFLVDKELKVFLVQAFRLTDQQTSEVIRRAESLKTEEGRLSLEDVSTLFVLVGHYLNNSPNWRNETGQILKFLDRNEPSDGYLARALNLLLEEAKLPRGRRTSVSEIKSKILEDFGRPTAGAASEQGSGKPPARPAAGLEEEPEGRLFYLRGPGRRVALTRNPQIEGLFAVVAGDGAEILSWKGEGGRPSKSLINWEEEKQWSKQAYRSAGDDAPISPRILPGEPVLAATVSSNEDGLLIVTPTRVAKWNIHHPNYHDYRLDPPLEFKIPLPQPEELYPGSLAFSPDRKLLLVTGKNLEEAWIQNLAPEDKDRYGEDGIVVRLRPKQGRPISGAFHPKGKIVAVGTDAGTIELWHLPKPGESKAKSPVEIKGHGGAVLAPLFSPDGKLFASGDARGGVLLWELSMEKAVTLTLRQPPSASTEAGKAIYSVSFVPAWRPDPSGRGAGSKDLALSSRVIASAGEEGAIHFWDAEEGKELARMKPKEAAPILDISFSPDGQKVGAGRQNDTLALWKVPAVVTQRMAPLPGTSTEPAGGLEEKEEAKAQLREKLANADVQSVIPLLIEPNRAVDLAVAFPDIVDILQRAGYQGLAQLVPLERFRSAPVDRGKLEVFIQRATWVGPIYANLYMASHQGMLRFVTNREVADVVIGDETLPVLPRQVLIQVNPSTAQYVTPELLNYLDQEDFLAPGTVVILHSYYKGDFGEGLLIFV